jgi:hypothetical protein
VLDFRVAASGHINTALVLPAKPIDLAACAVPATRRYPMASHCSRSRPRFRHPGPQCVRRVRVRIGLVGLMTVNSDSASWSVQRPIRSLLRD